ncbi:MAG: hypothetical protein M1526_06315 [Candidatus Thermoplasmatota archaeon]|jgi:cell division GTPase FtsZ|nr:hypothetical protein [Candidatus Thermoplasmatota archaeon]
MSDKIKIIGVGGAGKNSIPKSFSDRSYIIASNLFHSVAEVKPFVDSLPKTDNTVIVTSPAGLYSSKVLPEICRTFHTRGERTYIVSIMPFNSESQERRKRAYDTLKSVKGLVDSTVYVENENFASSMSESRWDEMIDRINSKILSLINGFLGSIELLPQVKEMGIYHSEGRTINELERNLILSTGRPSEGMIGTAEVTNNADLERITSMLPIEILEFSIGNNYSISGALLYSHLDAYGIPAHPSAPYIHIH